MKNYAAVAVLALFATVSAFAHGGGHKKIMGTITKIDATMIHVKSADGHDNDVKLTAKTRFEIGEKKASFKDAVAGRRAVIAIATDGTAEEVSLGKMTTKKK